MPNLQPRFKSKWDAKHAGKGKGKNWNASHQGKKTTQRGYGADWRKKRDARLKRDSYLCQPCLKAGRPTRAVEVDHIVHKAKAKALGWTDEQIDDEDNLQSICHDCHKAKTLAERAE